MSQRTERLGDLIRTELASLLLRELRDPRVKLATVTSVRVSPDLRHADVRISALGSEPERAATIAALIHARGFLRRELAQRLSLRVTPELKFHLDRGAEHSQRINELLEGLGGEEPGRDS
jgi:ribosome-binding factor A